MAKQRRKALIDALAELTYPITIWRAARRWQPCTLDKAKSRLYRGECAGLTLKVGKFYIITQKAVEEFISKRLI